MTWCDRFASSVLLVTGICCPARLKQLEQEDVVAEYREWIMRFSSWRTSVWNSWRSGWSRSFLRRGPGGHSPRRAGIVNVNVEPIPTWLLTQIRPPWSSTNFRHRVSPSPVPSTFLSAVPTCRNSSNTAS